MTKVLAAGILVQVCESAELPMQEQILLENGQQNNFALGGWLHCLGLSKR